MGAHLAIISTEAELVCWEAPIRLSAGVNLFAEKFLQRKRNFSALPLCFVSPVLSSSLIFLHLANFWSFQI